MGRAAAGLLMGLAACLAALATCIALSLALIGAGAPLTPLLVNFLLALLLLAGIAGRGLSRGDWGMALEHLVFLGLWAVGSQIHAYNLAARHPQAGAPLQLPRQLQPHEALTVQASTGLLLDEKKSSGVRVAMAWECLSWCTDLLTSGRAAAIVLEDVKARATGGLIAYRLGRAGECAARAAAPQQPGAASHDTCITSAPVATPPDGLLLRMGERRDLPNAGGFCCTTAELAAVNAGSRTPLAFVEQANAVTVMPFPIVFAGLRETDGRPGPWFMMRDVALGPPVRFDTVMEALLGGKVDWGMARP